MGRARSSRTSTPVAPRTWAPAGTLTIDTVAAHWTTLQAHLGATTPLAMDLAAVERVDTAGVQLLLQARRLAAGIGQTVQVQHFPMAPDARRLLGITDDAAAAAHDDPAMVTGQER